MSLSDVVNLDITIQSSAVSQLGFGRALILPATVPFAERAKIYTSPADMLTDGFLTTDQVYLEAVALVSQRPRPVDFMVGKRDSAVAQVRRFKVRGNTDGNYVITIDGIAHTFAASSNTAEEIRDGLISAVNGGIRPVTAAAAGATTDELTITADTAGVQFTWGVSGPASNLLSLVRHLTVADNDDGTYTVQIGQIPVSYAASGASIGTIRDALVTALDAATSSTGVDAAAVSTDEIDLYSTADYILAVSTPSSDVTIDSGYWVANVGIPEALALITAYNPDWYCLLITERTDAAIESAAAYIETVRKVFIAQSGAAAILAAPYNSADINTDIASRLHGLGYTRTALVYCSTSTAGAAAAWAGRCLPETPGSITWKFKTPAGVAAESLTATQLQNLRGNPATTDQGKAANALISLGGRSIYVEGTVASGEFIDVIRGVDKLYQEIQTRVYGMLVAVPKVNYDEGGLEQVASQVRAALQQSTRDGLIAESRTLDDGTVESPAFTITVPAISSIGAAQRATRMIPADNPITFEATLAGAVHYTDIDGTVSA